MKHFTIIASVLAILLGGNSTARAQSDTWDGETNALWNTAANWVSNTVPGTVGGDIATFNGDGNGNTIIDLGGVTTNGGITFDSASAAAYTIGVAGVDSLHLAQTADTTENDALIKVESSVTNDQTIAADIVMGDGQGSTSWQDQIRFINNSSSASLNITGDIAAGTGGAVPGAQQRLSLEGNGAINISGDFNETPPATSSSRIDLHMRYGAMTFTGSNTATTANYLRTYLRDDVTLNVNGPTNSLGDHSMEVRYGTLNLNSDQTFWRTFRLGDPNQANGNAAVNIGAGRTAVMRNNINYIDDSVVANTGTIAGGSVQLAGANRTIIVHDNAKIDANSPELTITSDIINDGSDRDLYIRGADNEPTGGTVLLTGTNASGAVTVQSGRLQLGSGSALDTGGDFLRLEARNSAACAESTTATVDLMGCTNTVDTIQFGNLNTATVPGTNNFQGSIVDSVGGGRLVDADIIQYYAGSPGKLNGPATISADVEFDASGTTKNIWIRDGGSEIDLTISGTLTTVAGEDDDDFHFGGPGVALFSGDLGNAATGIGGHHVVDITAHKVTLGPGALLPGTGQVNVRQRNHADFSDYDVVFDINGETVILAHDLVVSQGTTSNVTALSNTYVTDSAGTGRIHLTSVNNNNDITFNAGNDGAKNKTAYISTDLRFEGSSFVFSVGDGADTVDLDVSGTITDDNGGGHDLSKNWEGTLRLSATNNVYDELLINGGTLIITSDGTIGDNDVKLGNLATDATLEYTGVGETIDNQVRLGDNNTNVTSTGAGTILNNGSGTLTFSQGTFNEGRGSVIAARMLTLGGANDIIISGTIQNNGEGATPVGVTKNDAITVMLNGNNTYTGPTAINGGTVVITGGNASDITVGTGSGSGANLDGEGTTTGSVTFAESTHTITVDTSTSAALGATGIGTVDVTALGAGGFSVNLVGGGGGTIDVLTYGAGGGSFVNDGDGLGVFTAGTGFGGHGGDGVFSDDGTNIQVTTGIEVHKWAGRDAGNPSYWDEGLTANWTSGDGVFYDRDSIIFDDTASEYSPALQESVVVNDITFSDGVVNGYTIGAASVSNTLTLNGTLTYSANGDSSINVAITGNGSITKDDSDSILESSTLTLGGANTFTGGVYIGEGTLAITTDSALGAGLVTIDDAPTGSSANADPTLDLDADGLAVTNDIWLTNGGGNKQIRLVNDGVSSGLTAGTITILETSPRNFDLNAGADDTLTVSGRVTGNGAAGVNKIGDGLVVLANASNDFTGELYLSGAGHLEVASIGDSGSASHAGAGSLLVLGHNDASGSLAYTGAGHETDRQVQVGDQTGNNNRYGAGAIWNNGSGSLIFDNPSFNVADVADAGQIAPRVLGLRGSYTGTNEVDGAIIDNVATNGFVDETVGLLVDTAGAWQLDGDSTYTGPTAVDGGLLLVNGDNSAATGAVTVASGGSLGGSGTVGGATTVLAGGGLSPGASVGTLTFAGDVDISGMAGGGASNLVFELGSSSDMVRLTGGTLNIGSGLGFDDFAFSSPQPDTVYTLFDTDTPISGTLGSTLNGYVGGRKVFLRLADGNRDLVLAVPPDGMFILIR